MSARAEHGETLGVASGIAASASRPAMALGYPPLTWSPERLGPLTSAAHPGVHVGALAFST